MNYYGNYIATDDPAHPMSPNYKEKWRPEKEVEMCAYYCGNPATTENVTKYGTDKCCHKCLKKIIKENEQEFN